MRSYRQRHVRYTWPVPQPPHTAMLLLLLPSFFWCRVTFAMMASGQPSGAAQRRRQRRLRSWWRHEQQSIAAALAAATHHSAQQNGAPRSQRTATRAREEAGSETYYAPRGPKTLPPGVRPAPPSEVAGPQGSAATGGYVAAAPLLAVSSLRGADGVPHLSTACPSQRSVALAGGAGREEEEEKDDEEEEEEEQEEAPQVLFWCTGTALWATRSSLSGHCRAPLGCRRPKMLDIMAGVGQKDSYAVFAGDDAPRAVPSRFHRCSSWTISWPVVCNDRCSSPGAVLGQVLTCPLLCLTGEVGPDSTENRGIAAVAVLRRWLTSLLYAATSSCSSRSENNRYAPCKLCTFRGDPPGAALGQCCRAHCVQRQALVFQTVQKPVGAAHHHGHLHPRRGAEFVPHGSDYSADHRDTTVAVPRQRDDMPAVVPHRCSGPASQKAVEIPLLQFFDKDSDMPVVVQRQALVSTCGQLRSCRICSSA